MIHLDLRRDLTQAAIDAARPNLGKCKYAAPCIVGAMIPDEAERKRLDAVVHDGHAEVEIETLVVQGLVSVPDDQREDFARLQCTFDNSDDNHFQDIVDELREKYGVTA